MSSSIRSLQPDLQPWAQALVDAAGQAGLLPQITSTLRTHAAQERLYRRYLAGMQPYPVARPGTSAHEFGWAFDMVVTPMTALPDVGATWEDWGGVWGGHPRRKGSSYDPVHFEWPDWRSLVGNFEQVQAAGKSPLSGVIPAAREVGEIVNPYGAIGAYLTERLYFGPAEDLAAALSAITGIPNPFDSK